VIGKVRAESLGGIDAVCGAKAEKKRGYAMRDRRRFSIECFVSIAVVGGLRVVLLPIEAG
jgi:hypothetical protein